MALDGALIVQSDKTLLLEVDHERSAEARRAIAPFAELERAPEHIHTYRVTPLGLWNARAAGHDAEQVVDALLTHSRYPVPQGLLVDIADGGVVLTEAPPGTAPLRSRVRHYSRLDAMAGKLRRLLVDFEWGRVDSIVAEIAGRIR